MKEHLKSFCLAVVTVCALTVLISTVSQTTNSNVVSASGCDCTRVQAIYKGTGAGNGTIQVASAKEGVDVSRCIVYVYSEDSKVYYTKFKTTDDGTFLTVRGATFKENGKTKKLNWNYQIIELVL